MLAFASEQRGEAILHASSCSNRYVAAALYPRACIMGAAFFEIFLYRSNAQLIFANYFICQRVVELAVISGITVVKTINLQCIH